MAGVPNLRIGALDGICGSFDVRPAYYDRYDDLQVAMERVFTCPSRGSVPEAADRPI